MNVQDTAPVLDPVNLDGVFKAPVERVWRAWTEPDEVVAWFGLAPYSLASAEIDLRVGGRWAFSNEKTETHTAGMEGEYLAIEPNRKLEFSWSHVRTFADGRREATPVSRVTVLFEPMGKATRVRLVHSEIRSRDGREGVTRGWTTSFASLQAVFDGGAA
jgi:uncharacterized protein YndB with AHSA1/START domain